MTTAPNDPLPPRQALPFGERAALPLLLIAVAAMLAVVTAHVVQSGEYLIRHLVIDDAIYFAKPARNFVDGHGFSFDGLHRTSGVQPLWAIVVTVFAALLRDDIALLRAMVLAQALAWTAGSVLLARLLWPRSRLGGAIAAIGFLLAGLELRLCMTGMENGLQALLLPWSLLAARRLATTPLADPAWRRRARGLGALAAALALNRVEFLACAAWLSAWVAIDRRARGDGLRGALTGALQCLWVPAAVMATWSVSSRLYFGDWMPISGSVKAVLGALTPPPYGDTAGALVFTVLHAAELTARGLVHGLFTRLLPVWPTVSLAAVVWTVIGGIALPIVVAVPQALTALARGAWRAVELVLLGFAAAHLVLLAVFLAMFVQYCGWYFTAEVMAAWLLVGLAIGGLRGGRMAIAALPIAGIVVVAASERFPAYAVAPRYRAVSPTECVDPARFLERWLPPGRRVGAFNAGFLAFEARSHTVINLDGLMNDGRYLREYLAQNRIDAYLRDTGIEYLADHLPLTRWRDHHDGRGVRLPTGMRPLYFQLDTATTANCVLAVPDANGRLPAVPPLPTAGVAFAALVLGDGEVVADAARAAIAADRQVAATVVRAVDGAVLHVVLPRERARTAVDVTGVARLPALGARLLQRVELLAADVPMAMVEPGAVVAIDTFWRPLADLQRGGEIEFELALTLRDGAVQVLRQRPAHGTLPLSAWASEQVLAHTFVVALPADLGAGALSLGVRVLADGAASEAVPIGALQVQRW